jgi:hypothetical protein
MKEIILNGIGVLLGMLLLVSCDDSNDIVEDKSPNPIDIVKKNDASPVVNIVNGEGDQSVIIGDAIELKCTIDANSQLDKINWTIEYVSEAEKAAYSFVKLAGVKLDAKSVDYSIEPLLLANPLTENMAEGSYLVRISVSDIEGNVTEISYSMELRGKQDSFNYDGEAFDIAEVKSSVRNVGTDKETCQLQLCAENSSVSPRFVSKGSVVWFNLKAHDELGYPEVGIYKLPSDEWNTTVYINNNIEGKVFKTLPCSRGYVKISKDNSNDQLYKLSFELFTEENEKIAGNCLREITL